ncbi:MAG: hypothetical protein JWN30_2350 [Bacilli bacterium]|nr:hypothetical protein [Bacilli bacterium]
MKPVHLVMGTPNLYIQAPDLLSQAGEWIRKYGTHILIITGNKSWQAAGAKLESSLRTADIEYDLQKYRGECSYEEVNRIKAIMKPQTELIVGVGGGKVIDTAKALAEQVSKPLVTCPTLSATCAAVTPLSIMYTEDGVYVDFPVFRRNSLLTLVDTDVMAQAPVEFLIAGIGDTLAKWYEALASSDGKPHNLPTIAGLQMAKLCFDILIENSAQAISDIQNGKSSEALEKVIDAIILISGTVGGFGEVNCRSAAAHAVHNGLSVIPEIHQALHGAKVAYGILVQLVLENRSAAEIQELLDFYKQVGLPCKLSQLGIDFALSDEQLREIARVSLLPESTMNMMPFAITEQMVVDAIHKVEQMNF